MDSSELQASIGHEFKNKALLGQALTHRSYGQPNNERLEFLGDSILNCVIAVLLFEKYPALDEGDLSRLRSNLVKQQTLHEIAQRLSLGTVMRMGDGEQKSGGQKRPSMLADCVEAVIGAVFLDAGFDAAAGVIRQQYQAVLDAMNPNTLGKDAKTLLQEFLQGKKISLPVYTVVATLGAAHNQVFEVECAIQKLNVKVLGSGGSRRAAEQAAAKAAMSQISLSPLATRKSKASIAVATVSHSSSTQASNSGSSAEAA